MNHWLFLYGIGIEIEMTIKMIIFNFKITMNMIILYYILLNEITKK